MDDPFARLQRRLARDDAVSEVVAYTLMFGMGAIALTFSMETLIDTQQRGNEVAAANQMNQVVQVTARLIEEAARTAHRAPNATFNSTIDLPAQVGGLNYTVLLYVPNENNWATPWTPDCPTNARVRVVTTNEQLNAEARLSNRTTGQVADDRCVMLDTDTTVDSSDTRMRVVYEWGSGPPTIRLDATNR